VRYDKSQGPMGKIYAVSEEEGQESSLSALAELVKRSGRDPKDARQELVKLIEQIPDEDLTNFIGAQVSVVT